jgi:hypothetical protein
VEALTAVTLLAGKYGVQRVIGTLTGRQDLSDLAGELFGTLAASEARLSERLAGIEQQLSGIEQRLDEVLGQRYQVSLAMGLRGILEAGVSHDPRARTEELTNAHERFREAAASAHSVLQAAVAERYILLCAIALGRPDAAKTAWAQLNGAVTAMALDLCTAFEMAHGKVALRLDQEGALKGRGYWKRLNDEADRIRDGVMEAAGLAKSLLVESAVLGQMFGQPQPPYIDLRKTESSHKMFFRKRLSNRMSRRTIRELSRPESAMLPSSLGWAMGTGFLRWHVQASMPGPVRFGALVVTWKRIEQRHGGWDPGNRYRTATSDADVELSIQADPPLSRDVSIGHPFRRGTLPRDRLSLEAGASSTQLSYITALPTDERGNVREGDWVQVDGITFHNYFGPRR